MSLLCQSQRLSCKQAMICDAGELSVVLCLWQVIDVERYEVVLVSPRNHFMCAIANQCLCPKVSSLSKQHVSRVRDPREEGRERVDAGFTPMLASLENVAA